MATALKELYSDNGPYKGYAAPIVRQGPEASSAVKKAAEAIGDYNAFDGTKVAQRLNATGSNYDAIQFGREGSPVVYLWPVPGKAAQIKLKWNKAASAKKGRDTVFYPDTVDELPDGRIRLWWD